MLVMWWMYLTFDSDKLLILLTRLAPIHTGIVTETISDFCYLYSNSELLLNMQEIRQEVWTMATGVVLQGKNSIRNISDPSRN